MWHSGRTWDECKTREIGSSGKKVDESWWWNEEVQDCIKGKRLVEKKWATERTEEGGQVCREIHCEVELGCVVTSSIEIDRRDVQQVRVMDDNDGNVWICARNVIEWDKYFK